MNRTAISVWVGYLAAAAALGLAAAHLTAYTVGFVRSDDATLAEYLAGGVAISAVAIAFAASAVALVRFRSRRRGRLLLVAVAWVGCVIFTVQAAVLLTAGDPSLFRLDRPGLYSLVAGPAFGVLAWRCRHSAPRVVGRGDMYSR